MEKDSNNNKNNPTKLSKMLQKALTIGHSASPFSPARDFRHHRTSSTANRGFFFYSPIKPLVATTAKVRKSINKDIVFAEPTSPKVSCIGQINLAKSGFPEKENRAPNKRQTASSLSSCVIKEDDKGSFSKLKRLFSTRKNPARNSNSTTIPAVGEDPAAAVDAIVGLPGPSFGKMKKFASSREALGGFDWTVQKKREESQSDHRRGSYSDNEDVMIPCSVSMPLTQREGLSMFPKPKSEVNLWKRRTMDRPKPLQVKATS